MIYYYMCASEGTRESKPSHLDTKGVAWQPFFYVFVMLKGGRTPEVKTPPLTPTLN